MRPGATRIETDGSVWFLDDDGGEYLRMPKVEGPRQHGPNGEDWGGPDADRGLQDLTWHPMVSWEIRRGLLAIHLDEDPEGWVVVAPISGPGADQ